MSDRPVSGERKFLHDISSPLCTALFELDILLERAKGAPVVPTRLERLAEALGEVLRLVEIRKLELVQPDSSSSLSGESRGSR